MTTCKMPCDGVHHFEDITLTVPKVEIAVCNCGKYQLGKKWTDNENEVLEYIMKKTSDKFTLITKKQYEAWVKRKLGITLNSTERTQLQRFFKKAEKIKNDYYEVSELEILNYP